MLVFSFDDFRSFPLLETYSRAEGDVRIRMVGGGEAAAYLHVGYTRVSGDAGEVVITLGLPLVGIAGALERIMLDVIGDESGCVLHLEGSDVRGRVLNYVLGSVGFVGPGTCGADARKPAESWGTEMGGGDSPVCFHRLRLVLGAGCRKIDVGLVALRVGGVVRFVPTGIC